MVTTLPNTHAHIGTPPHPPPVSPPPIYIPSSLLPSHLLNNKKDLCLCVCVCVCVYSDGQPLVMLKTMLTKFCAK